VRVFGLVLEPSRLGSFRKARFTVPQASQGDTVHVHYTGRLDDGTIFDSSLGREPIEFTLGKGQVIAGFEKAVEGLSVGEKKAARIGAEDAYGPRSDDLVQRVQRDQLPGGAPPSIGQTLEMTTGDGYKIPVRVTETDDETVEVDANHPLAGKDLTFDLELVKIDH
jgi:FKBP-type peptidyl-prolyl cis-trans isomerase 2